MPNAKRTEQPKKTRDTEYNAELETRQEMSAKKISTTSANHAILMEVLAKILEEQDSTRPTTRRGEFGKKLQLAGEQREKPTTQWKTELTRKSRRYEN